MGDDMTMAPLRWLGLLLLLTVASGTAHAHSLGQTYLYLSLSESTLDARFEIAAADVNRALGATLPTTEKLTVEQVQPWAAALERYVRDHSSIRPEGRSVEMRFEGLSVRDTQTAQYVLVHFVIDGLAQPPQVVDIDYSVLFDEDPKQSGVLVVENDWKSHTFANEAGISLVFKPSSRTQQLDLTGSTLLSGLLGMVHLGAEHIIEGIDHVLFLIAILLPSVARREGGQWRFVPRFRTALWNVAKIVTVFTIAHSITLSLAALEILNVSSRVVESVIAASIVVAALDVFYPILGRRVALVVFAFGLFHGAGFAGIILDMDIHPDYTVWTLFGFNLGVEVGQLIIVCVIFPLLFIVRRNAYYLRYGMPAIASVLVAIASYWFIERALEVDLHAGEYANWVIDTMRRT